MSELFNCPFCGGKAHIQGHGYETAEYRVYCEKCGCSTELWAESEGKATAAWNRRAQPANEPLTLEQLREMDFRSDPIWDSCLNVWCAVRTELSTDQKKSIYYFGGGNRPLEANRFYSRKPEGELRAIGKPALSAGVS